MFKNGLTFFINSALKVLLLLVSLNIISLTYNLFNNFIITAPKYYVLVTLLLFMFLSLCLYCIYKAGTDKISIYSRLIPIIAFAFLMRLLWIINVDTVPFSDFGLIYDFGRSFASGDYYMFKGTEYIARFSHLTVFVVYTGFIHMLSEKPLFIMKLVNVILSTASVYIIFLLCCEIYSCRKKGLYSALAAAFFPPFIMYTSVCSTESIAMPFFLTSLYIFILVIKGKIKVYWLLFSGVMLSVGNLFRVVGPVILIAYIMYIIIYYNSKKIMQPCICLLISFLIPLYAVNTVLLKLQITEYSIWKGREPSVTSILKGTNIKHGGGWNEEDAALPERYNYDYDAVSKASKELIKERLTATPLPVLTKFYITKFTNQWAHGDFAAQFWSTEKVTNVNQAVILSKYTSFYNQAFYLILFMIVYLGLFNKKLLAENPVVNLFYILFCGFGLLYLITEMQPRYAYIVSWIFIVLSPSYGGEVSSFMRLMLRHLRRSKALKDEKGSVYSKQ
jgi:hypothetical protein